MLVRESINFERTGNVKSSLGIGYEAIIRKFFRDLDIPDEDYNIKPDGEILFKTPLNLGYSKVTELPNNLNISQGYLNLRCSNIIKLPNGLIINGWLGIDDTTITEVPDDLQVKGFIFVSSKQTELIDFMENSKFKDKLKVWD